MQGLLAVNIEGLVNERSDPQEIHCNEKLLQLRASLNTPNASTPSNQNNVYGSFMGPVQFCCKNEDFAFQLWRNMGHR